MTIIITLKNQAESCKHLRLSASQKNKKKKKDKFEIKKWSKEAIAVKTCYHVVEKYSTVGRCTNEYFMFGYWIIE